MTTAGFDYGNQHSFLIVADDAAAATAARSAIEGSGARAVGTVAFDEAEDRLAIQVRLDGIVVETAGLSDDRIARWLPPVAAWARDRQVPVIATASMATLDAAWAVLDNRASWLCEPAPFDRTVAIAGLIPLTAGGFNEATRAEDERIHQLNAEIARFSERLRQFSEGGVAPPSGAMCEPTRAFRGEPIVRQGGVDPAAVRAVIRSRRLRSTALPAHLFADPAWDMLLDLYAATLEHRRVSVSSLCIAADVPGTTALRWIGTMVDAGLFERRADSLDRRRAHIYLTEAAREGMDRYFEAVRQAGLAPA